MFVVLSVKEREMSSKPFDCDLSTSIKSDLVLPTARFSRDTDSNMFRILAARDPSCAF